MAGEVAKESFMNSNILLVFTFTEGTSAGEAVDPDKVQAFITGTLDKRVLNLVHGRIRYG